MAERTCILFLRLLMAVRIFKIYVATRISAVGYTHIVAVRTNALGYTLVVAMRIFSMF
jgi:hypothetical protein